jgi:hypothetical protein
MSTVDFKQRATRPDMQALTEDQCAEIGCGMTILVDKEDKEQGRRSRCVACLMRNKLSRGTIK